MKLRTRLMIALLTMILGPVILFMLLVLLFGSMKGRSLEREYGMEFSVNYLVNSPQIVSESTQKVWDEMQAVSKDDPDRFLSFVYLEELNDMLEDKLSYLLLIRENEIYYQGIREDQSELAEALPDYREGEQTGKSVYVGGRHKAVVKQLDMTFSDGTRGSAFVVTATEAVIPQIRTLIAEIILCVILVLAVTAAGLVMWIHQGINTPIHNLQEATKRITEGDLDFTLHADGKDEISELTRNFETMRSRLKESEEERARFDKENKELISNISHDLKTPITTIKGYVEGIMDGVADTPEKMDRYIRTIYNKANDMDRLINELTFYSKIDSNRIPYNFTRLNVVDFFDDCAEELSIDLEEKNIVFSYEVNVSKDTRIIADPEQIKRVINNIVDNSVKYMDKPTGRIELRVLDAGDFIQVEIEDNGKGIEAKDLVNIFDRFYRTDQARTTREGGSGIGLSIVKKIIEDHSGKIWAGSHIGRGTTMYFVIRKYQETGDKNEQSINY